MVNDLISVIITTYNRKKYLEIAVNSVLNQSYSNVEIIIIDDCSSDGTYEYVNTKFSNFPNVICYRNKKNRGCGYNRKYALDNYAKGEFIIFLDDDDKFVDNMYFQNAVELFRKKDNLSIVCGSHFIKNIVDNTIVKKEFNYNKFVNNKDFFINFGNEKYPKPIISVTIIRRDALEKTNYREMKILNDTTIFLRALLYGPMGFINKEVAEYLVHGNNISFNCNTSFIIDNLNEKIKIYNRVNETNQFNLSDDLKQKWLHEQLDITIIYFINGSKPNIFNFNKVIRWYKKNAYDKNKVAEFKKIYKESRKQEKLI